MCSMASCQKLWVKSGVFLARLGSDWVLVRLGWLDGSFDKISSCKWSQMVPACKPGAAGSLHGHWLHQDWPWENWKGKWQGLVGGWATSVGMNQVGGWVSDPKIYGGIGEHHPIFWRMVKKTIKTTNHMKMTWILKNRSRVQFDFRSRANIKCQILPLTYDLWPNAQIICFCSNKIYAPADC